MNSAQHRNLSGHRDFFNRRSRHQYCLIQGKQNIELTADVFRIISIANNSVDQEQIVHVQCLDSARNRMPRRSFRFASNMYKEDTCREAIVPKTPVPRN